jgi:hypothetical protein
MSFNLKVLFLVLLVITVVSSLTYFLNKKNLGDEIKAEDYKKGEIRIIDKAYETALIVYRQKKKENIDFDNGPCLTNDLMEDWVADVAHNPRQELDNYPENQCIAFIEGRATHFVELDPEGNLIRIK